MKKGRRLSCVPVVAYRGRPNLDLRVGKGTKPPAFPLRTAICISKSVFQWTLPVGLSRHIPSPNPHDGCSVDNRWVGYTEAVH